MAAIGTAYVDVALDPRQISSQVNGIGGQIGGKFGGLGKKAGLLLGGGLVAGVGAAVVGAKALYDVGAGFDAMSDGIRVATGKTDGDLKKLEDAAKRVAVNVPASFEDAGSAVSTLSTRLGLSGKPLEDISAQVLDLARLTGTDLPTALDSTTRMLGDAGLKGADAGRGIDEVFRASQATQVPVDRLMGLMTKFGSPMRALGYSFEEQAALLGNFESQGVNTELVMGSMRKALGKLSSEGKDAPKALRETIDQIANAGSASEATAAAVELFGAKAGPDMAAAIREGRFGVDELVDQIKNGSDTVRDAGADTEDFAEKWTKFKNRVAVAVAPVAEKMFAAVGDGMGIIADKAPEVIAFLEQSLGPALAGIGGVVAEMAPGLSTLFDGLVSAIQIVGPAIAGLGPVFADIGAILGPAISDLAAQIGPLLPVVAGVFGDIAIIIRELAPVWKFLATVIAAQIRVIASILRPLVEIIAGVVRLIRQLIQGDWQGAWETAVEIAKDFVDLLKAVLLGPVRILQAILAPVATAAKAIGNAIKSGVTSLLGGIAGAVSGAFNSVIGAIRGALGAVAGAARAIGSAIREGIVSAVTGLVGAVQAGFGNLVGNFTRLKGLIVAVFASAASWLLGAGRSILSGLASGVRAAYGTVTGAVSGIRSSVMGAVSGAASWLYSAGQDVIRGFVNGMGSMLGAVTDKARSIANSAKSAVTGALGISSPSKVMIEVGSDFTLGFVVGAGKELPRVTQIGLQVANAAISASKDALGRAGDQLGQALGKAYEVAGKQARAKSAAELELVALEATRGGGGAERVLTESEKLLAQRQALRDQAARDQQLADARQAVATARSTRQKVEAQAALDQALYDAETYALEQKAEQERIAQESATTAQAAAATTAYETRKSQLEAQIALEQQQADAEEWLRSQAYSRSIANLQAYLSSKQATQAGANARITDLMAKFGLSYAQIGATMGVNFESAVRATTASASGAVKDLGAVIRTAIANLRKSVGATKGFAPGKTARSPIPTRVADDGWAEPPPPSLSVPLSSVGMAAGAVYVNVQIGDQQLRDVVRTEISRGNDALAAAIAAGVR